MNSLSKTLYKYKIVNPINNRYNQNQNTTHPPSPPKKNITFKSITKNSLNQIKKRMDF